MKALVYKGKNDVAVEDVASPQLQASTDAIVTVTSAAICGSDLHMYDGRTDVEEGKVLGHEIMGVVSEVGKGVQQLKVGDRVVLPFNIGCGLCFNCLQGWSSACLTLNPDAAGAAYGYADMGPYAGGQAEAVRVPYADYNALKLPGKAGDKYESDFLMLADIFPTAWHATELANVQMGSSLVIYGAGPVGLLSIMSAKLKGAAEIYCVDMIDSRLKKAAELGATPIDFRKGTPSEQIQKLRQSNKLLADTLRPGEEKRLEGVDNSIDAIGYQSHNFDKVDAEYATQALSDAITITNPTGHVGVIGVYMPADPGAADKDLQQGLLKIPYGLAWSKGLTIAGGQAPVKKYNEFLRDLIIAGKANPGTIVSHNEPLEEAPDWYERFDQREEGITKVVLHPKA